MINRAGGGVGYRELALILRDLIVSGEFGPGARLPSETDLIHEHGLNRTTVRKAIDVLEEEGLVDVRHGYGTRVRIPPETTEVAIQRGATWTVRMPTPDEREEFDLPRGVPMVEVRYGAKVRVYPGDRHTFTAK